MKKCPGSDDLFWGTFGQLLVNVYLILLIMRVKRLRCHEDEPGTGNNLSPKRPNKDLGLSLKITAAQYRY